MADEKHSRWLGQRIYLALLWNFHPYCRKAQVKAPYCASPFEDLNQFRYHDNWLRNLLLASSLNGRGHARPSIQYRENKVS